MPKKKKESKLSKFSNFLKPTTPKKGLLLFAIVFGLAGGTYAVYKSHAASWAQGPSSFHLEYGEWKNPVTDGHAKGSPSVAQLHGGSQLSSTIFTHFSSPTRALFCFSGRAPYLTATREGTSSSILLELLGTSTTAGGVYTVEQSYNYTNYCKDLMVPAGDHNVRVHVTAGNNNSLTSYNLYVANVSMNW